MPVASAPAVFRVVGVEVEVDPSPDTFAALRRVYSIIREAPEPIREAWTPTVFVDYDSFVEKASLLDAQCLMRSADLPLFFEGLQRAGSPVPRKCAQRRVHIWLELLESAGQGVTG